jgi:hypothetical protein
MRGLQLSKIAKRAMPLRAVHYTPLGIDISNSDVFLTKGALRSMTMPFLESLRGQNNTLLYDVVDQEPPPYTEGWCDVLVAASVTAFEAHRAAYPNLRVALVNHHVDPRLRGLHVRPPQDSLRVGYFGEIINTVLTDSVTQIVTPVAIDTSRISEDWLRRLKEFNFHYAVRATRELDHFKPFLKGFTAAHCRSNILIQDSEPEAVHWLGDDYPYLLRGPVTESSILSALDHAKSSFGSAEWHSAMAVMDDIRARTSPKRIGKELIQALDGTHG